MPPRNPGRFTLAPAKALEDAVSCHAYSAPVEWVDPSVLEAVSWRLASELVRRHPDTVRLIRAHPGGGQSDCLWILPTAGDTGDIRLNRHGTIQVLERFDGRPADGWEPTEWGEYIGADPRDFLHRLEVEAGLPSPHQVPASRPTTLTSLYYELLSIGQTVAESPDATRFVAEVERRSASR